MRRTGLYFQALVIRRVFRKVSDRYEIPIRNGSVLFRIVRCTLKCSIVAQILARRAAIFIALVIQRQVYHDFTFGTDINTGVIEITIGKVIYWYQK